MDQEGEIEGVSVLDEKKAQLAYEKVFDEWEVDLTGP